MQKFLFLIAATALLSCQQNKSTDNTALKPPTDSLDYVQLPEGFHISVYAEVPDARSMCWGEKGTLFVGNRKEDKVYALRDEDGDGFAEKRYVIAEKLNTPNGVAFRKGSLYVAEINRILRFDDIENKLSNPPKYVVVNDQYPDKTWHGWKFIAFGPDDKLYVPVGAPCNVCDEKDSIFAAISRINPDGSGRELYARGVRNSVGFTWHPVTKEMWFTDNGRDMLGEDIPYCELNHAPAKGIHFGFPYIHQGNIPDPEFGKGKKATDYTAPAWKIGPHVAPLGLRFYTGKQFPDSFQNKLFIAEHGSWNRSKPIGYRVGIATFDSTAQKVVRYEYFAQGWLDGKGNVKGRPVDIEIAPDGALLVSDDYAGKIYRITYK
ncbi:MAG TPA: sorbosone dehydrogenase [Chitinophagaceae bacterium]|nr:sorbosone dehydrogenase [Chitinophagaceae bacterium]